jgi:hypothetical protein
VKEAVDLWQIEMLSHTNMEKHILAAVKLQEGIVKVVEGRGCM